MVSRVAACHKASTSIVLVVERWPIGDTNGRNIMTRGMLVLVAAFGLAGMARHDEGGEAVKPVASYDIANGHRDNRAPIARDSHGPPARSQSWWRG